MSRHATARLFAAVELPAGVRESLCAWARASLARAGAAERGRRPPRVLDPESLHLTLCFLGSRPVAEIEPLARALESCPAEACELSIGAPVWLPPRRPHALAVEVHDPAGGLARLQADVSAALARASGWEPERRRFRPHVTIVRLGHGARAPRGALPATPQLSFSPGAALLLRSWLAETGATYELLASRPLTGAPA